MDDGELDYIKPTNATLWQFNEPICLVDLKYDVQGPDAFTGASIRALSHCGKSTLLKLWQPPGSKLPSTYYVALTEQV